MIFVKDTEAVMRNGFKFTAYMGPPPADARDGKKIAKTENLMTKENYANIKACGFDGVTGLYEHIPFQYKTALDLCKQSGLKYNLRDQTDEGKSLEEMILSDDFGKEYEIYGAALAKRLGALTENAALNGILACDEPSALKFKNIRAAKDKIKGVCPSCAFEVNLLPDYASAEQLFGDEKDTRTYDDYLEEFIKTVEPEYLCYDHYALLDINGVKSVRKSYIKNLRSVAEAAERAKIPFEVFLLTLGHWDFRTVKTYADIGWQVFTSLAYGAAGAQTFTYWTMVDVTYPNEAKVTTGVVGQKGELLPAWYAMKEVIADSRSFEKEYFGYLRVRTAYYPSEKAEMKFLTNERDAAPLEELKSVKTSGDLLIGLFKNSRGEKALLVADLTDPKEGKDVRAELVFNGYNVSVVKGGLKNAELSAEKAELTLKAGGGCFALLNNK